MSYLDWFSDTATGPAKPKANTGGAVGGNVLDKYSSYQNFMGTPNMPAATPQSGASGMTSVSEADRILAERDASAARARAYQPSTSGYASQGGGGGSSMNIPSPSGSGGGGGVGSMQAGHVLSNTPKQTPAMIRAERERAQWATEDRSTQQKLIESLTGAQAESKEAGETRYQELLDIMSKLTGQVGGTYDAALGEMEGMGTAGRARIGEGRTRALAESEQDLMGRGLGNTTIRSSVRRGVRSDYERQLQELNERVSGQRSGLLQQRAGAEMDLGRLGIDTRLSRQDVGPDVSQYLSLIQMLGQSQ